MLKLKIFFMLMLLTVSIPSNATCYRVTSTSWLSSEIIAAGYTATSWSGGSDANSGNLGFPATISLSTSSFTPSGTLLASSTATFLTGGYSTGYAANQILYRCALADAGSLLEFYATNGDDDTGGRYETEEVEGAYYTAMANVAIRLTNVKTGNYFSKYWQSRTLTSDDWVQDSTYIYIPASAFSDVYAELFKINDTTYYRNSTNSRNAYYYSYAGPAGYIAFQGPGISASLADGLSSDGGSGTSGWYANWPGAFSLYRGVTFVRGAMCSVKDYPTIVILPSISVPEIVNGEVSQQSFSITLSCEDTAVSSLSASTTTSANVAMGFLVNEATAVTAASNLGLTSTNGVTYLLDTNYGSSGVASGVGIRIYNESGTALNLLSKTTTATGNAGGWYAYKDLTTSQGDSTDGVTTYTGNFTASLEAISGETVTAGSVNAQLQVVVSFQ